MAKININVLLEDLKSFSFKEGQTFETLRTIYPNKPGNVIKHNNKYFTKPFALDKKSKKDTLKEADALNDFFKETSRGDFVRVVSVSNNGKEAICENLSLKDDIKEKYYKENFVLENSYLKDGSLKLCKRKIDKYLKG